MRSSWLWPTFILLATIVTGVIVFIVPGTPLLPFVSMSFILFFPGMALIRFLYLDDIVVELSLAFALSLAVASLIGGTFIYSGSWPPSTIMAILLSITSVSSLVQLALLHPAIAQLWGIKPTRDQSTDILAAKTVYMGSVRASAQREHDIMTEKTLHLPEIRPNPAHITTSQIDQKDTIGLPGIAEQRAIQYIEYEKTRNLPSVSPFDKPMSIEEKDTVHVPAAQPKNPSKIAAYLDKKAPVGPGPGKFSSLAQRIEEKDTLYVPAALSNVTKDRETETSNERKEFPGSDERAAPSIAETHSDTAEVKRALMKKRFFNQ